MIAVITAFVLTWLVNLIDQLNLLQSSIGICSLNRKVITASLINVMGQDTQHRLLLCMSSLHQKSGPTMFTVEIRSAAVTDTWMNPKRGVETVVREPYKDDPIAVLHQGAVDALAPFLFISLGCRYDTSADMRGCDRFAITQEAAYVG